MVECGDGPRLTHETVGERRLEDLDGDRAVKLLVESLEDLAHSADGFRVPR